MKIGCVSFLLKNTKLHLYSFNRKKVHIYYKNKILSPLTANQDFADI